MARFVGKAGSITLATPATTHNIGITSFELDLKGDTVDTTGMDYAGIKEYLATLTEWSGSFEGFVDGTLAALTMGLTVTVFTLAMGATGAPKFTSGAGPPAGKMILNGLKISTSVDGAAKVSGTFQGSGVLTVGVV